MRKLFAGMAVLALWTGAALAQNAPDVAAPTETTAGPSSSVTTTRQTIDGRGVETNAKETYDTSQSYTSGNGELSAKTTATSLQSQVDMPPAVVTKRTTTTTTDETSH